MANLQKYLSPKNYRTRIKNELIRFNHFLGREVVVTEPVDGFPIRFKTSNYIEYLMRSKGSYEAEASTMQWIREWVKPDDVVFDIGSNVGAYSLFIGHKIKANAGKGMVYAFEPESLNFSSLNKNIVLNRLEEVVLPVPLAIGEKLNLAKFFLSRFDYGAATHGLYKAQSDGTGFTPAHVQGIMAISLDELVRLEGVRFPNHIKIDVDGLESTIVNHMKSVLPDPRVQTIMIEISDKADSTGIRETIQSFGFYPAIVQAFEDQNSKISNTLFVRKTS